jgi:hypothetical protein
MPTINVDVDVDLYDFDDDELVSELENRDYIVYHKDDERDDLLTKEDKIVLLDLIDDHDPIVGSSLYFIREKIANGA